MLTFFDIMDLCVQFWPEIMGIAFGKFYCLAGPGEVRREYCTVGVLITLMD
jgi:hypothetical protein